MSATLVSSTEEEVIVQMRVPLNGSMQERERAIRQAVNEAGNLATQKALEGFDTDGGPIEVGGERWSSKGALPKAYQTPYGEVAIVRHVYQRSRGGQTYCPLEHDARVVITSTPAFARLMAWKYAELRGVNAVREDLAENHARPVAKLFVQELADAVASVAEAKEQVWQYALPELPRPVASVSAGMDGTCLLFVGGAYREAMVGTIAYYDRDGQRMHTTYAAASPQYGKAVFRTRFGRELDRARTAFAHVPLVALADGAADNWDVLGPYADVQTLDFYHVSEYLTRAADVLFAGRPSEREAWLDDRCHRLKHEAGYALKLLAELKKERTATKAGRTGQAMLDQTVTYFTNHHPKMTYALNLARGLPIGSGVTEAACKVIVKERLGGAGMKWKERGAAVVLSLRALVHSTGQWAQFWQKIDRYGFTL